VNPQQEKEKKEKNTLDSWKELRLAHTRRSPTTANQFPLFLGAPLVQQGDTIDYYEVLYIAEFLW
jgi:hypothetical protein